MTELYIGDLDKTVTVGAVLDILDDAFENAATSWSYWLQYDAPEWLRELLEDSGEEFEFIRLMEGQDHELIKSLKFYAGAELARELDRG